MSLATDLQKLIEQACATTWSQFDWVKANAALYGLGKRTSDKWTSPGEPAFVSMLADSPVLRRRLARLLAANLPAATSRGTALVSGVFAPNNPKVRFGKSASQVDIGDLLLVRHHYQTGQARPEGRAFLMTAKASTTPRTGFLRAKQAHQYDLYADWSAPIVFPNGEVGAPPEGKAWELAKGPAPHELSGVYGIVSSQRSCKGQKFPDNCPWAVGPALPSDRAHTREARASLSLAAALDGFMTGRHGRPWHVGAGPEDHWSNFVEQVLRRSIAWTHQVQRIGGVDLPKKRPALSFIQSFLAVEVNAKLISTVDKELSFEHYVEDLIATVDSIGRQAAEWSKSIEAADDAPAATPPEEQARGGMSVLYVATFGEGPLEEARADWVPIPEAIVQA
jgi:hypothetical protein